MPDQIATTLRPAWRLKMIIFIVVALGVGAWGYYDASVAYPRRGERHAEFLEQRYLQAIDANPRRRLTPETASVERPAERLEELREFLDSDRTMSGIEQAEYQWLRALATVHKLTPERTTFEDPRARLTTLTNEWATRNPPKPLYWYDLAIQWLIFGLFTGVGVLLLFWVGLVSSRRYRWEPESRTLTLLSGEKITPSDLADVDKRKWDKFLVFLRIRDDHPTLGGREIKVDLYRRAMIEGWILQMERERFPERVEEDPEGAGSRSGIDGLEPGTSDHASGATSTTSSAPWSSPDRGMS